MNLYEHIIDKLTAHGISFKANDNISQYLTPDDLIKLEEEVAEKFQEVLKALVIDIDNDHNTRETAKRVAKMFMRETFAGRYIEAPKVTSFPNEGYEGMYTSGPISIRSTCAHHFQNIVGKCWVGVIPQKKVIGLSKFNRIIHHIAERPQIQEEMTTQIANALVEFAETPDVAVLVKAEHHCMLQRGVKEHESDMTTAILKGSFFDKSQVRQEFYNIVFNMKGHS